MEQDKQKLNLIWDIVDSLWLAISIAILAVFVVKAFMVGWTAGLILFVLLYNAYILGKRFGRKEIISLLSKPEDKNKND